MSLFRSQEARAIRKLPGQYVEGVWTPGRTMAPFYFPGTFQPATGAQVQTLPEGKRIGEVLEIITNTELTPADPETQMEGDQVEWNGRLYDIVRATPWKNGILPHYEYLATRTKEGQA